MCFFCFFLKPHSHLFFALRIQQIEKQRKKEEQRTDSKNREKTERIHKQGEKNRQDTYLRVVEWRTADVVQISQEQQREEDEEDANYVDKQMKQEETAKADDKGYRSVVCIQKQEESDLNASEYREGGVY